MLNCSSPSTSIFSYILEASSIMASVFPPMDVALCITNSVKILTKASRKKPLNSSNEIRPKMHC